MARYTYDVSVITSPYCGKTRAFIGALFRAFLISAPEHKEAEMLPAMRNPCAAKGSQNDLLTDGPLIGLRFPS